MNHLYLTGAICAESVVASHAEPLGTWSYNVLLDHNDIDTLLMTVSMNAVTQGGGRLEMIARRSFLFGAVASLAVGRDAFSQCAPIDLRIPNIQQQTQVWCWAAVAQQIIVWKRGNSPPQCALVAMANNAPPQFCCSGNPQCHVTGHLNQIQFLIGRFGGSMSQIAPPAGPRPIYQTLQRNRAIIMAVRSSPFSGHVVVIRGISCHGPNVVLHVNDPLAWGAFTQPIPFQNILPYWQAAIIVA